MCTNMYLHALSALFGCCGQSMVDTLCLHNNTSNTWEPSWPLLKQQETSSNFYHWGSCHTPRPPPPFKSAWSPLWLLKKTMRILKYIIRYSPPGRLIGSLYRKHQYFMEISRSGFWGAVPMHISTFWFWNLENSNIWKSKIFIVHGVPGYSLLKTFLFQSFPDYYLLNIFLFHGFPVYCLLKIFLFHGLTSPSPVRLVVAACGASATSEKTPLDFWSMYLVDVCRFHWKLEVLYREICIYSNIFTFSGYTTLSF